MKSSVPSPLLVWILLSVTVISGIFILSEVDPVRVHIKQRREELPKKLQKTKKAKTQTDVVFFGDSLLQAVIPPSDTEMNETLSRVVSTPVKAVNLAMDGRTPWDLERRSDQIVAIEPQNNRHSKRHDCEKENPARKKLSYLDVRKERLKNWISYLKNPLMRPIYGSSSNKTKKLLNALSSPAQVDIKILKEKSEQDELNLEQMHQQRAREHWSGQIIGKKSPEFKSSSRFIEKAFSNGTRIIVVETPISETAALYATDEFLQRRKEVVLSLLNEPDSYLQYPKVLPDRFFDDYSHANARGQKVYFKWLATELGKKLERKNKCRRCRFFFSLFLRQRCLFTG